MSNKIVLITGAGRGIGASAARLFASHGYAVCINYRSNKLSAQSLSDELLSMGAKSILVQADVSDESQVVKMFDEVDQQLGAITVLVNNAGILKTQANILDLNAGRINEILTTNVTSAFLCSREAVRRMSTQLGGIGGSIINVSSVAARTGSPNEYIDYAASKGALDTLTIGLSREVAGQGIRVNSVRPGIIDTDIHADGGEPGRVGRLTASIPMQRGGEAQEVAEAIYWLASERSSFTTGSFVDVAGGL